MERSGTVSCRARKLNMIDALLIAPTRHLWGKMRPAAVSNVTAIVGSMVTGFLAEYDAAHIRAGDKVHKENLIGPHIVKFMFWQAAIRKAFGNTSAVFILSDNCTLALEVVAALRRDGRVAQTRCQQRQKSVKSQNQGHCQDTWNHGHTCMDVYHLLADLENLRRAKLLFGNYRSNLVNLAVKLRGGFDSATSFTIGTSYSPFGPW